MTKFEKLFMCTLGPSLLMTGACLFVIGYCLHVNGPQHAEYAENAGNKTAEAANDPGVLSHPDFWKNPRSMDSLMLLGTALFGAGAAVIIGVWTAACCSRSSSRPKPAPYCRNMRDERIRLDEIAGLYHQDLPTMANFYNTMPDYMAPYPFNGSHVVDNVDQEALHHQQPLNRF